MQPVTVVTSFSPNGYALYGKTMLHTFRGYWPAEVEIVAYVEGQSLPGVNCVDLLQVEACRAFLDRHAHNKVVCGRHRRKGHHWKDGAIRGGYNFRFDAYKFARKVFAIADAAKTRTGRLYWVDADCETHARVDIREVLALLPDDVALCYLARPGYHSECGFVGYNLDAGGRAFIEAFAGVFADDSFQRFSEWHDSYVFDRMIEELKPVTRPIPHTGGTPVEGSALGRFMRHYKGKRKSDEVAKTLHKRRTA